MSDYTIRKIKVSIVKTQSAGADYTDHAEGHWINDRIKEGYKSFYDNSMICNHHYTTNGATWKGVG